MLVLQHHFDLSHTEIAETLGIPLGTVKARIRYGTAALRASLDADDRTDAAIGPRLGMNNDGQRDPMADDLGQRSVGPLLAAWMDAAAPERAPERLLEESFARTMVSSQAPVYPWHALRRERRGRRAPWGIPGSPSQRSRSR